MIASEQVGTARVDGLVSRLVDPGRQRPVIVVSVASDSGQPRIDPDQLARQLPSCDVVVLDSVAASDTMSRLVPDGLRVYGGSVRCVWPGASKTDTSPRRHRLFLTYPGDSPEATIRRIVDYVTSGAATRPGTSLTSRPVLPAGVTPADLAARFATPTQPTVTADPNPEPPPEPEPGPPVTSLAGIDELVRRAVAETLVDLLGDGSAAVDAQRTRADDLQVDLDDTRARLEQALRDLADARTSVAVPTVYTDPQAQLRYEITQAWLAGTPEPDRGDGPRPYIIDDDFIDSLKADLIDRRKVVAVVAEVLNRTVSARRTVHPVTSGGRTNIRDGGAMLWRAYLKAGTPGAPRLTYWDDGHTVTFVKAAHHDDY